MYIGETLLATVTNARQTQRRSARGRRHSVARRVKQRDRGGSRGERETDAREKVRGGVEVRNESERKVEAREKSRGKRDGPRGRSRYEKAIG